MAPLRKRRDAHLVAIHWNTPLVAIEYGADPAANVAVSTRTLTRHFKESTGDSRQVLVQKVRVEMSKALIETTQLRMDAILEPIGHGDDSAFRCLFRKYTGFSPRKYRERSGRRGEQDVRSPRYSGRRR